MQELSRLTHQNLTLLRQARKLVEGLSDELFTAATPPLAESGVGSHLRHCLDYYRCFLDGLGDCRIDYDLRCRDRKMETRRAEALAVIDHVSSHLEEAVLRQSPETPVVISSDSVCPGHQSQVWTPSTVQRELQTLISHTVHHFALIAMLLRAHGFDPGREFGVAPSTLEHWRQEAAAG